MRKRKQRQKQEFSKLLEYFKAAVRRNDILEIQRLGQELIYNEYLNQDILSLLREVVDKYLQNHPDLKELSNAIMNKQIHFDRHIGGLY